MNPYLYWIDQLWDRIEGIVIACWNDQHGYIELSLAVQGGVRQLKLNPNFSPPCNVWQSPAAASWVFTAYQAEYEEYYNIVGAVQMRVRK